MVVFSSVKARSSLFHTCCRCSRRGGPAISIETKGGESSLCELFIVCSPRQLSFWRLTIGDQRSLRFDFPVFDIYSLFASLSRCGLVLDFSHPDPILYLRKLAQLRSFLTIQMRLFASSHPITIGGRWLIICIS